MAEGKSDGHILRGERESLVKEVIEWRIEGKSGRGKPDIMTLTVSKPMRKRYQICSHF